MNEDSISIDSTCEEVSSFFEKKYKLDESEKDKLIKEGISGDVLFDITDFKTLLNIRPGPARSIKKYINYYKDKFIPKEIDENIPIQNKEEIKMFFEKRIGFRGDINSIKGENDLIQLKEEDMIKLGLNIGQRIKLTRYINHFNPKDEKDIFIINITKESSKEDITNYLKNQLKISQKSIENIGLDNEYLFEITTENVNEHLMEKYIQPEEGEMLTKFIKKRDELFKCNEGPEKNEISDFIIMNKNNLIENFESKEINYCKKEQIMPFQNYANNNIFFIIALEKNSLTNLEFGIYQDKSSYLAYSYINYDNYLINVSTNKNNKHFFLFQILSKAPIPKLNIEISNIKEENNLLLKKEIPLKNGDVELNDNFILDNINSNEYYNYLSEININECFTEYLNYFFDEKSHIKTTFQKNLIFALNLKISKTKNIELSPKTILKYLNCIIDLHQTPANLENIKITHLEQKLDKKLYISNKQVMDEFEKRQRNMIFTKLLEIYSIYDIEFLLKMISYGNYDCCRIFFDLILFNNEKINVNKLKKSMNENQILKLQNILFKIANNKEEIEFIIRIRKGLENNLNIINENLIYIIPIIDKEKKDFKGLKLDNPNFDDNIKNIFKTYFIILNNINNINNRDYKLLQIEDIFEQMIFIYKDRDLDDYLFLNKICESINIKKEIKEKYYNIIHEKGFNLIKEKKMTTEEILLFIQKKDIYYKDIYSQNINRNPDIFKYIPISSNNKDYEENIKLIKKFKVCNLFDKSNPDIQKKFYLAFLEQIKKFNDINNIFEIFSSDFKNYILLELINEKIRYLIPNILEENKFDISYIIINKWILCNINNDNNDELKQITKTLYGIKKFTSDYYIYLLKSNENQTIYEKIKDDIISFFDKYNQKGQINERDLIYILKNSQKKDFDRDFLNKLERKILSENDFYTKAENKNFEFFKLFMENFNEFMKKDIKDCEYVKQCLQIQNKILLDLKHKTIEYETLKNLISEDNIFLNKIKILANNKEGNIYQELKDSVNICKEKLSKLYLIKDYYNLFYKETKKDQIKLINDKIQYIKSSHISLILELKELFKKEDNFDMNKALNDSKNIKYGNSKFFMAIYEKNKEKYKLSENILFKQSQKNYKEVMENIITLKENKLKFFELPNVNEILNEVNIHKKKINDEIEFILEEFKYLNKNDYIKNNLLDDLISYSQKDIVIKLMEGILRFIDTYNEIEKIEKTEFSEEIKKLLLKVQAEDVNKDEITETINILSKKGFNIKNETHLIKFYKSVKKDAILFIKTLMDSKLEIRNLNEFVVEDAASELQTSDIDNLIYIFEFFETIFNNKENKTDLSLIDMFGKKFNNNIDIFERLESYQKIYGEIKRVYQLYDENPVMTIEKIRMMITNSVIDIYKNEENNDFTFKMMYIQKIDNNENQEVVDIKEIEELRNKTLLSSNNSKTLKYVKEEESMNKMKIYNDYINLIDDIKQLTSTLNKLSHIGYPHIVDLKLNVKNSVVKDEKGKLLKDIIEKYKDINNNFTNSLRDAYEKFPLLRLFYGQQLIQLYKQIKNEENKKFIFYLINSVSLNQIKNIKIVYQYNKNINELGNINQYLENLFNYNNINFDKLFEKNKVLEDKNIAPGFYRKVNLGSINDTINNILNIYLNLTNNIPTINTLLVCNKDTSIENIHAFLYRAIFCNQPILFAITNIECLELSNIKSIITIIKSLYKEKRNKLINSYLLFLYEKTESGLARFLEKLIPEKNSLDNSFLEKPKNTFEEFEKIHLYSADFSGFGKTTEIKYKVKEKKGNYFYLPIGGTFTRDYVIKNLLNLNIDLKKGKMNYLHLDLSETDNDDLMVEILFKILILRYIDSKKNIYYLGKDIHIMIEIPKGFYKFDEKYKLLNLFHNIHIKNLFPLRLEENVEFIKDSPISIVAEVLDLYDKKKIGTQNIDLGAKITKKEEECEKIINKYFDVENKNYYQKMNFIKILSVQFKKFTENYYLDYSLLEEDDIKRALIEAIRPSVISNLISLTKVFTRSPYDSVLMIQNTHVSMFGKINENHAKKEEIEIMADETNKQEIFSFEKIKPSLVFFNRGGSLSIISNKKDDEHYKELKLLWNSNNPILGNMDLEGLVEIINHEKMENLNELIDYKSLNHEQFLEEIKNIFSLDKFTVDDLKEICIKLGNYIFVSDNFIKMVRILLNIEAKIPVILMGETGVGKTKLLEMLATLYGKGTPKWHKLQIHAGITDQKIVEFIEDLNNQYSLQENKNELVWIFFDEINTCNSLGLITEIMCNHTYLGKKINDNFIFLGACNPYRLITKKMKESGLVYYNMKDKNKLNNLVYTVNPLPHSLLNFIFDFGSLQPEDEKKYIKNAIIDLLSRFREKKIIKDFDTINEKDLEKIREEIIESISICHTFMRKKYDNSSVSLREIKRFGIFFEYFIKYFNGNDYESLKKSLNMTLYLCYYLRLNDKNCRIELSKELKKIFDNFLEVPENEMKLITNEMTLEKDGGIALNRPLRENLFTSYICIDNSVPLIIIGKPGTGKSLSFQILYNTLKGEYSKSKRFKEKGKLYRYYYQGSGSSTSEGIEQIFKKALKAKINNEKSINKIITLVFFDEMGLAERSSNNPLKIIHFLLEKDIKDSVPFLGISNWKLDSAKINRALNLSITDYDQKDLEETAIVIAEALDKEISNKHKTFFEALAKTYYDYLEFNKNTLQENQDFHGNRDFYNLIKTASRELIERRDELDINKNKVLTETGLHALDRNFSGLEGSNNKIKKIFKEKFQEDYDMSVDDEKPLSVLEAIKKNLSDSNSRYLMLISEGNDGRDIVKYLLNKENKDFIELIGSKYESDEISGRYSEEILNKIKYIMETNSILILKDLDIIYPSLYDLFNQNFILMGEKRFARIAFEFAKISSEVNKNFHVIVLVNKNQIKNLKVDPPFLNRFEKHIINYETILEKDEIEIAKKIKNYIDLIASFNNNPNLKIDLDNLLFNSRLHNIEGLIFKIKNNNKEINKILKKEEYEKYLVKEVFKYIVPTFCQDIIASMLNSGIKLNNYNYNEIVLDIYNNSCHSNFISFFEKIEKRKNIIYTFSKITEDIFKGDFIQKLKINNKYGKFNEQSSTIELINSIKSQADLTFILKSFIESKYKNLLILRFAEKDLDKISLVHHVVNNIEKDYPKLKEKLILFIIHKKRILKMDNLQQEEPPELISFYNDDYYQIFIDNLNGKENLNISELLQDYNIVAEKFIYNSEFIKNKIYKIVNYLNYNILYESKNLNKRNYSSKLTTMIINNDLIQNQIINTLKGLSSKLPNCINDIFLSDSLEINDIDFIELINTKLSQSFLEYLLKIIYSSLNDNILNPFIINKDINSLLKCDYFNSLIKNYFENYENFNRKLKMDIFANKITIYNGLKIPKSKQNLNNVIKYFSEINERYYKTEESLRKTHKDEKTILMKKLEYKKNIEIYINNLKIQIIQNDFFSEIIKEKFDELLVEDYLVYYITEYTDKKELKYELNESLMNFLKLLVYIKINKGEFENNEDPLDKLVTIIMFTQGYKEDIEEIFNVYLEVINYCDNIENKMKNYLNENKIIYEESQRCKAYSKTVNLHLFLIIESLIRTILLNSKELIIKDKEKFLQFFKSLPLIETSLQKINKKYYLFSKEIYNIRNIIQIGEAYKDNYEQFENNFIKIIDNLLSQSTLLYSNSYDKLYNSILELINIIDKTFNPKNDTYSNLLFFIFRQEYKNIYNEDIRIKLLEKFFNNKSLIKHSKLFLVETLKNFKPEVISNKTNKDSLINNFMDINYKKFEKIKNIINICNKINSEEFYQILLYFFEGLCQSYFFEILKKYNNEYTEECCNEMLNGLSLDYLKKAIQFKYENKDKDDNNLLKIYSISYIKSYCHFYVIIHKNYYEKCYWEEINKVLYNQNNNNNGFIDMISIYILRLYYKTFQDFEEFLGYEIKKIPILDEIIDKLKEESINEGYVFNENLITPTIYESYKNILNNIRIENEDLNFDLINNNLDAFYCCLVNKTLSFKLGKNKEKIISKMKKIFEKTKEAIKLGEERKHLYEYLLIESLFSMEISNKISMEPLKQNDLEILFYSLRFIFNTKENENNFYYNLLKPKAKEFINKNFLPGSFQIINEYIKSYIELSIKLKLRLDIGYYICKDCGFLYEVEDCSFPTQIINCIKGHKIGGIDHVCHKRDIRVFYEKAEYNALKERWLLPEMDPWFDSFEPMMNLEEFKEKYVKKNMPIIQKGIVKNYESKYFENLDFVRNIDIITFRLLNFILYSYLFWSNILKRLSNEEIKDFLIKDYEPNLFYIIRKNWELLDIDLKKFGVENVQVFFNMTFDKVIEKINNLDIVNNIEKFNSFENDVNNYIKDIVYNKENVTKINRDYKILNNDLNKLSPKTMKEIIKSTFDPSEYDQKEYPEIQYYSVSSFQNFESFRNKFNSIKENADKYFLINLLLQKEQEITKNAINLNNIQNLNKLGNILINIYSYKISRDEAKNFKLSQKLGEITSLYNQMNQEKNKPLSEKDFQKKYIDPFIESWDKIKDKCIQYRCTILKNEKGVGKPLDINMDSKLSYFLVDTGDQDGGIFLASAYEHLIEWQNKIINIIIERNKNKGMLNMYIPQLEKKISIQDATENDIINLDEKTYLYLEELIMNCSMRNIFNKDVKIDYKNYFDNIYDYDYIEKELSKKMLQGKKKFKVDDIKCIIYKYEEFRGEQSSILIRYNEKYQKKELSEEEKQKLEELLKDNKNTAFYHDISSSLQILMNQIIIDNYVPNKLIYEIIINLPPFIIINEKMRELLRKEYESRHKIFPLNTLITIYEYFESLFWEEIKKQIPQDYQIELNTIDKEKIIEYFEKNKNENKIVNKKNFTTALRRLISRFLISSRQETEIKPDLELNIYIRREELWNEKILETELFMREILDICKDNIKIRNCYCLYNILDGDQFLKEELGLDNPEKDNERNDEDKNEINMFNYDEDDVEGEI